VAALRELSQGRGADQVIVTGGGSEMLPWATEVLRDGGSVHYFAGGAGDALPIRLDTLYHRESHGDRDLLLLALRPRRKPSGSS